MFAKIQIDGKDFKVDFAQPLDISIPLSNTDNNPIAWYLEKPVIEPVRVDGWVGKVGEGSSTNFNNIRFNPHGHGTHTECLGHITRQFYSINETLKTFLFTCQVITISPKAVGGDLIITRHDIENALMPGIEALVIRTSPNTLDKKSRKYSNSNPPYLEAAAATLIRDRGVAHLLIDLPSVDREHDEGKLLAHKAFWNVTNIENLNDDARLKATITEMVFVSDEIQDGLYLLNLQIASFENDASPSKPILYQLKPQ